MTSGLAVKVDDLVGHPERDRHLSGARHVSLRLGEGSVQGDMIVEGVVSGTVDGVQVSFRATAVAHLRCVRCLAEWSEPMEVSGAQHFSRVPDEDGYAIVSGEIDVGETAREELAYTLPPAPLCRRDCQGLCPICGTDLNDAPCDGHGEELDSPFAVLRELFDS